MVAGEDGAAAAEQRHPAARLERLRRLVDHHEVKCVVVGQRTQRAVLRARVGAQHDLSLLEHLDDGALLPARELLAQRAHLRAQRAARALCALASQLLLRSVELGSHVGCEPRLVGAREARVERGVEHARQHARRVADPHEARRLRAGEEALRHIVDGHIRRRARQDALAARHRLAHELDDRRGLAGARRPVDAGDGPRGERKGDGVALARVEPRVEQRGLRQRQRRRRRERRLAEQSLAQRARRRRPAALAHGVERLLAAAVAHVVVQHAQRQRLTQLVVLRVLVERDRERRLADGGERGGFC